MQLDVLKLTNFSLSEEVLRKDTHNGVPPQKSEYRFANSVFYETVAELAYEKPLWMFVATEVYAKRINLVTVFHDGEEIGMISSGYYRNNNCVVIDNERVRSKRDRGGAYRTANAQKAVSTAKKLFGRKSGLEQLNAARLKAEEVIRQETSNRMYEARRLDHGVEQAMLAYVRDTEEGARLFAEHLQATHNTVAMTSIKRCGELKEEVAVINRFSKLGTEHVALVVRSNGLYIVKIGEHVTTMTDNELPMDYRAKIGLLKLVEARHFVTDCGGRIDEDTFVIGVEPPNNVTQQGE